MSVINRAFLYVIRKKAKSLALLLLFLLVTSFITVSFSVLKGTEAAAAHLRETVGASFSLRGKVSSLEFSADGSGYVPQSVPVSQQTIRAILENREIKAYNAQQSVLVEADGFYFGSGMTSGTLCANTTTEWNPYFTNGTLALAEGRHITEKDQKAALVSRELADENSWQAGDELSLYLSDPEADRQKKDAVALRIMGIYESDPNMEFDKDMIFTDHAAYWKITGTEQDTCSGKVDFFVTDPARLLDIMERMKEEQSIQWEDYTLSADKEEYDSVAYQLSVIVRLTTILIISAAATGGIILLLILTMRVKSRVHEAGVLLAVGIGKGTILLQFILEAFSLLVIAVLFSCPVGFFASAQIEMLMCKMIGNMMLPFSAGYLIIQYIMEVMAVIGGVLAAAHPIIRLNPKEILSRMS